ncbi:MAG TPA: P1 family peptidase [Bryobacteraceae bacterium]|jgi:L-aminopeptidase/D-esterase-like protein|nr:P1 family peptidase [Bryobacteraceae bacterium]
MMGTHPRKVFLVTLSFAFFAAGQTASEKLIPRTSLDGKFLDLDFPAVHIGTAEYEEGPTGATVFYFPNRVTAAVDVRGGGPATVFTDILRLGSEKPIVSAISFAGGSAYGLAAAGGVAAEIRDTKTGTPEWNNIAVVPGAIIYDLAPRRFNKVTPDEALGRAALRAARPGRFLLGAHGAGRFAVQGSYFGTPTYSGQGGAFHQAGLAKVAVFTVVNARGAIVDRSGKVLRCGNDPSAAPCGFIADRLRSVIDRQIASAAPKSDELTRNTTITLVVINCKLTFAELQRLAVQVHTSMARAIQPFHTDADGDTLFAVSTNEVNDPRMSAVNLGVLASEVAWDAVLSSLPVLDPVDKGTLPDDASFFAACAGRYAFAEGVTLTVIHEQDRIWAEADGNSPLYGFRLKQKEELVLNTSGDLIVKSQPANRLRFIKNSSGHVTGLILNPGHWPVSANRLP